MKARYTASVAVRVTPEMLEELQKLAEEERRSVGSMIRVMLEEALRVER